MPINTENPYLIDQLLRYREDVAFHDALEHVMSLRDATADDWCTRLAFLIQESSSSLERILMTYLHHLAPARLQLVPRFPLAGPDDQHLGPPPRVDLLAAIRIDLESAGAGLIPVTAIACHPDKTSPPSRLERKRQRDRGRLLEKLGIPLLEISSAELQSDPLACALRVLDLYQLRLGELLRPSVDWDLTERVLAVDRERQPDRQRLIRRALTRAPGRTSEPAPRRASLEVVPDARLAFPRASAE